MEINGKVHLLFEQSGTFKNEFKKLGYEAFDYDIQNHFGQTDYQIDLFAEIDNAMGGGKSVIDNIQKEDLSIAFFPCIYFCEVNQPSFKLNHINYRTLTLREKYDKILKRAQDREYFYEMCIKMFCIFDTRGLRLIMENPFSTMHYLHGNFVYKPSLIDRNRRLRGDYFIKPTQYWFLNCEPTFGTSYTKPKQEKTIRHLKGQRCGGICDEERSLISEDYARNFIHDFILGKEQKYTQLQLWK